MENVGAIINRPVILQSKMTSPKAIIHDFPSGNPKLFHNLGGRSMIAPTVPNEQINQNLNLYEFLIKRPKPFYQTAQQSAAKPQKTKSIRFLTAVSGVPRQWYNKMAKGHFIKN